MPDQNEGTIPATSTVTLPAQPQAQPPQQDATHMLMDLVAEMRERHKRQREEATQRAQQNQMLTLQQRFTSSFGSTISQCATYHMIDERPTVSCRVTGSTMIDLWIDSEPKMGDVWRAGEVIVCRADGNFTHNADALLEMVDQTYSNTVAA